MSTHVPGFQSFFWFLHLFVLVKLVSSSIRVKRCLERSPGKWCYQQKAVLSQGGLLSIIPTSIISISKESPLLSRSICETSKLETDFYVESFNPFSFIEDVFKLRFFDKNTVFWTISGNKHFFRIYVSYRMIWAEMIYEWLSCVAYPTSFCQWGGWWVKTSWKLSCSQFYKYFELQEQWIILLHTSLPFTWEQCGLLTPPYFPCYTHHPHSFLVYS